jgi:hypothetical protein
MTKMFVAATSIFLFVAAINGQTAADLAKKYQHREVYEVQPGVQMTPNFDSNGVVCEMQVEQAHFGTNGAELTDGIDEHKVYPIIDQLVPVSERGLKLNTIEECVGSCQTTHEYSNVAVKILSGGHTRLITIKWRNRSCE